MRNLVVTLFVVLAFPATAAAGTFDVYGLGAAGAGCPSGWRAQTSAHGKLLQEDGCSRWRIWSAEPLEQGDFAAMSMYAGEGAQFTGFSVRASGFANNGVTWTMGMCRTPFGDCVNHLPRSGVLDFESALGAVSPGAGPLYSTHVYAGVSCSQPTCAHPASDVTHTSSHVIVDDFTAPGAPTISGVSTGWNRGRIPVAYTASDAGSGIEWAELRVDGEPHATSSLSCLRVPGGYSHPVPCATATGGDLTLDTAQFGDGRHTLTLAVRDAGGGTGTASQEFLVDNTAPDGPIDLRVDGGDGWRRSNDFAVSWATPEQTDASPMGGVYYKLGAAPTGPADGTFVPGGDVTSLASLHVPGEGEWPLHVWLQDEAGNAAPATATTTHLRVDTTPPALAFANERDPDNPAKVRAHVTDALSGAAGGAIEIRRRGAPEWRTLATRLEGTNLVASVPDHELSRGTYEFRATAWDGAGNATTSTARTDGGEMLLDLPLRGVARLSAALARRAGSARSARRSIRVPYGSRAWLRGTLRSSNGALPRTRLVVTAQPLSGRGRHWRAEAVTDAQGRYALGLPRGTSRDVRVRFAGNRSLRPAERRARLLVRGSASLTLRPSSLRRGGTIAFVGRVGRLAAKLPPAGKLVQIQYLDGRRWRPAVKLAHTRRDGRFAIRYRFRRISRPTLIYFRILVPAEGGWPYATGWSPVRVAHVSP